MRAALFRLEQIHDFTHEYHYAPEISARFVQNKTACAQVLKAMHHEDRNHNIRVVLDLEPEETEFVITSLVRRLAELFK